MQNLDLVENGSDFLEKIMPLYQRDKKSLQEDVTLLKNWMKNQPHLPEILDEARIQNFLIFNKCSIERAKRSIDMYYTLRSQIPDMYETVNPKLDNMKLQFDIQYWVLLPKLTEEMYRVQVFKMRNKEMVDAMRPLEAFSWGFHLQEIRLKEDIMFGDVFIFDMEGLNFGYFSKITPVFLAKLVAIYEKIYSIPMKGVYFVNSPIYMAAVIEIIKKLLNPKLFQRIHVCENTSVLNIFPKKILPKDYGGEEKSLEELREITKLKIAQYQDRFDKLDELKVDESLRPMKLENDEFLGFYGNFKKLTFD